MLRSLKAASVAACFAVIAAAPAHALFSTVAVESDRLSGGFDQCIGAACDEIDVNFATLVSDLVEDAAPQPFSASPSVPASQVVQSTDFEATATRLAGPSGSAGVTHFQSINLAAGAMSLEDMGLPGSGENSVLAAVPVPASLPLLLGALGLIGLAARRRA